MIEIGDKMPEFSLTDQFGNTWTNEKLAGRKVIIYAYPKDNTPGCTAEACNLRDNFQALTDSGYTIFGISKDSKDSHLKFAVKHQLPFSLLADTEHTLLEALGAWGEKKLYGKVSIGIIRKTFIFDENGICTNIISKVKTKDHAAQIL